MVRAAPSRQAARWRSVSVKDSKGGMTFDFDLTFVLQMLLFALLIVVLKPLLFEPVLRVFEEREKRTEGARDSARHMQEEAGELLSRYESELERVREVARQERERARAETARVETELMLQARESANKIVEEGRQRVDRERRQVEFGLGRESERLARSIAEAVLGRSLH
jgi:F-type H+-transporting ATPase subunit b